MQLVHGGDWAGYRAEFGRDALDFSANVSPLGLPEGVARAITAALPTADRYPDPLCRELRAKLALHEGVPAEQILCGNGAADLIFRLVWAKKPRRALVTAPTFAEYATALESVGCTVERFFLREQEDFAVTDAFCAAIRPGVDMVFLCQPNNPTGQLTALPLVEQILRRKAAQGVDVRLIYDDFGSLLGLPSDFVIRMEKAHIRCIPFNPVVPLVSLVMNHRDHRKIVVVDGNVAYTGGVNLADEYINAEQRFGYWKDAAIRLEGAAVWNFTVMFLNVWNAFRPQETDYTAFAPTRLPAVQDGVVQPYADSPLDEEPLAETVYLDILSQAQRYVYIYTPYLAVGEEMLDALKSAAKRGVDVRLILPGIPDKKLVFRLSRSYYLPLLRAGVRIYEFTPGFLHAKCYVSDDRVAVVGSINMDYRSLFLHFECGTLLFHNSQIAALRKDVERTLPQCREIMRSDCRTNLPGTALDSVLRLLSPLM